MHMKLDWLGRSDCCNCLPSKQNMSCPSRNRRIYCSCVTNYNDLSGALGLPGKHAACSNVISGITCLSIQTIQYCQKETQSNEIISLKRRSLFGEAVSQLTRSLFLSPLMHPQLALVQCWHYEYSSGPWWGQTDHLIRPLWVYVDSWCLPTFVDILMMNCIWTKPNTKWLRKRLRWMAGGWAIWTCWAGTAK